MSELGFSANALSRKEFVQVELIELTLISNRNKLVWHLVCHKAHLWQRCVRVLCSWVLLGELLLNPLLIAIGPVEDLLLYELTRVDCPKGCPRQIEIGPGFDWQEL